MGQDPSDESGKFADVCKHRLILLLQPKCHDDEYLDTVVVGGG
jgi:hypothetical protein